MLHSLTMTTDPAAIEAKNIIDVLEHMEIGQKVTFDPPISSPIMLYVQRLSRLVSMDSIWIMEYEIASDRFLFWTRETRTGSVISLERR